MVRINSLLKKFKVTKKKTKDLTEVAESKMDYEVRTAKEKNIKNKILNSSKFSKPSVVDKIEKKNTKSSKQLTIPDFVMLL